MYLDYIRKIGRKNSTACTYVRAAVLRHKADLKRSRQKNYPYKFDKSKALRAIGFFKLLRHTKGKWAGQHFDLQPWQAFILAMIYGWQRKDGRGRRFRKAYIEVPRKNGKTELGAGCMIYSFLADGEQAPEVYSAATTRDQAKIGFAIAKKMLADIKKDSAAIGQRFTIYSHNVHETHGLGKVEPLSSDHNTLDGLNPHMALIDEYHAHPTAELVDVLETGMGSREQPLILIITTAGFNINGPCYRQRKVVTEILDGIKDDETTFGVIWTLDEGDDWENEKTWAKANPNYPTTPTAQYMDSMFTKALNEGLSKEIQFKTKNLNVWTTTSETWIKDRDWMLGAAPIDLADLKGKRCYLGLDLAATVDLCALCLFFPSDDLDTTPHRVLMRYWLPSDTATERQRLDGVPYETWAADDHITLTPGNVADHAYIIREIIELQDTYDIRTVGYDRYGSLQVVTRLTDEGVRMEPFGQGFVSMSAPTKELERLAKQANIQHAAHPVLRWNMSNIAIKMDASGNIKIDKSKSQEKVDGAVALVMALGEWMTREGEKEAKSYLQDDDLEMLIF